VRVCACARVRVTHSSRNQLPHIQPAGLLYCMYGVFNTNSICNAADPETETDPRRM